MRFPQISDISNTSVQCVEVTSSIADAVEIMLMGNHRNVIIKDGDDFRILNVIDILRIQNSNLDYNLPLSELSLPKVPVVIRNKNVLDALDYLNDSIEYICVINPDKTLYGLVAHTDIISNIDPDTLMENYKLTDFLKLGRRVKWVKKDILTSDLIDDILNDSFENVLVVEDLKPIGILTAKDIVKLIKHKKDLDVEISEYMSRPVDTIHQDSSIKEALQFLNQKHYRRIVVVDDEGHISGIITQKELISLTYGRWATLMKQYQEELNEINHILRSKNRKYETMASTDSLTGLYNRYKFSELYLSAYRTMTQRHDNMSIILLDIDYFKRVNDTYGHNIGDQTLIQISHSLLKILRSIDIVCRWGGEEFIVLLPSVNLENASVVAEMLRDYIEKLEIDIVGKLTVSFGVSQVVEGDEMQDAIDRADKALYLAKNSGRNCVKTELDY